MKRELEWIHMGAKGRQAKHKEHITKYNELLANEGKAQLRDTQISIPAGPRLGDLVIEAHDLTKAYGDKLLFENLNFQIPAGAVVGTLGFGAEGSPGRRTEEVVGVEVVHRHRNAEHRGERRHRRYGQRAPALPR